MSEKSSLLLLVFFHEVFDLHTTVLLLDQDVSHVEREHLDVALVNESDDRSGASALDTQR